MSKDEQQGRSLRHRPQKARLYNNYIMMRMGSVQVSVAEVNSSASVEEADLHVVEEVNSSVSVEEANLIVEEVNPSVSVEEANLIVKKDVILRLCQASRAALDRAGCGSVADFLSTISTTKKAARCPANGEGHFPFQTIMFGEEGYLIDKGMSYVGLAPELFESTHTLLLEIPREDLVPSLRALPSVLTFTTLCLYGHLQYTAEEAHALVHALTSSFTCTRLFLFGPPDIDLPIADSFLDVLMLESLRRLKQLTSLNVHHHFLTPLQVESLFSSLKNNYILTSLSLRFTYCNDGTWATTSVICRLGCLLIVRMRMPSDAIPKIDLKDSPLEELDGLLNDATRSPSEKYLQLMGMHREPPSTVRVYLCGLPFSGKTTISKALAQWNKHSTYRNNWLPQCYKGSISRWFCRHESIEERTRGIEVTLLRNKEKDLGISIWDMAGQLEYHSFHDSMLPDLTNYDKSTPPLFLYVWNPFKIISNETGELERERSDGNYVPKSVDDFKTDFAYWLKFISSKTPKSESFKPKVIIAITREDLGLPDDMKGWLQHASKELKKKFQEYISVDQEGFFQVDARSSAKISNLASYVFRCAEEILKEAPEEFLVCNRARFLVLWKHREIPPLMSKQNFFSLVEGGRIRKPILSEDVCKAVAHSLSSSGDLIYFPSLDLVVTDPQWFCKTVMGDLLHFNVKTACLEDGFFPRQPLENFLEKTISSKLASRKKDISWTRRGSFKHSTVSGKDILKLIMGLRIACPRDYSKDDSDVFIPASLCGKDRKIISPSEYLRHDESLKSYIGRRWVVKDSDCTFFMPGIFPLIQVTFHSLLSHQQISVDLSQDVMAFAFGGTRVFVELCRLDGRDADFIDVLVGSQLTFDEALNWLHLNVMREMKKVFADPRGIPGVELLQCVIQPASVQKRLEAKERKAVPEQTLKDELLRHVQMHGVNFTEDGLGSIFHTWQGKPLRDDPIVHLLGVAEVKKLLDSYMITLKEAAKYTFLNISASAGTGEEGSGSRQPEQHQRLDLSSIPSSRQRDQVIYDEVRGLRGDMNTGFRNVADYLQRLAGQLQSVADQIEDLRGAVLQNLSEMLKFLAEKEAGKLPRMYLLTQDDIGRVRRVVSKIVPGVHNLLLELWCECRNQPCHRVVGDHFGLSITTLDENGLLNRGLPYINAFLKIAHVVVKVGAHVAVGMGNSIPDFTSVLAGIVDANQVFGGPPSLCDHDAMGPDFVKQGQQWLFDVLSHHDCTKGDQIYRKFGLRRIQYSDYTVAWVCDEHYSEGEPFPA